MAENGGPLAIRRAIMDYVRAELVGPRDGANEVLTEAPSERYVSGTLYPRDASLDPIIEEEEEDALASSGVTDAQEQSDDPVVLASQYLPASMGMSFYLVGEPRILVRVHGARYQKVSPVEEDNAGSGESQQGDEFAEAAAVSGLRTTATLDEGSGLQGGQSIEPAQPREHAEQEHDAEGEEAPGEASAEDDDELAPAARRKRRRPSYRRVPVAAPEGEEFLELAPDAGRRITDRLILDGAARLNVVWRRGRDGWLVTVSLINQKEHHSRRRPAAEDCLFQMEVLCRPAAGSRIAAYPRPRLLTNDPEEHALDLLYRHQVAYGTGHGCGVMWSEPHEGSVDEIRSEVLPTQEVFPITYLQPGFEQVLELGFLADGEADSTRLLRELRRFVDGYGSWIDGLSAAHQDIPVDLKPAETVLLSRMRKARDRMLAGIARLETDALALKAFCLANRAMLVQMLHSTREYAGERKLANALSYVEPDLPAADVAERPRWRPFQLAFQLLTLASVADPKDADREIVDLIWFPTGGGKTEAYLALTAFLLFYRRMAEPVRAGGTAVLMRYTLRLLTTQQFRRAATLICACEMLRRNDPARLGNEEISIGLWVGGEATPNTYQQAFEKYTALLQDDSPRGPFGMDLCPWCGTELIPATRSEDRMLYGVLSSPTQFWLFCPTASCPFHERLPVRVVDDQIYDQPPSLLVGTVDKFAQMPWEERVGELFGTGSRRPPELIIQDELHLISGPLGTIVGVYETAVDMLCSRDASAPKILASTATIRRADAQCLGLYARGVELFPPSGLSADDSYFARYDRSKPGRLYAGVMAPSHTGSTTMIRTSAALLQAPIELGLSGDALDAYWTLVAYHNSLRELGKSVTFGKDDIPARIKVIARDQAKMRQLSDDNVAELTSNIGGPMLAGMLERLVRRAGEPDEVSLLLCTNMLSVGVDVSRLGLMLVNGQPKSTSEYIQATSRVGRSTVPGLVVCVYSPSKPRDRSHYERFVGYHQALYRQVEPTSVTPFAKPARDRALHAVLVALVRHRGGLPNQGDAAKFRRGTPDVEEIVACIQQRVAKVDSREATAAALQLERLLKEWDLRAREHTHLRYSSPQRQFDVLLRSPGDGHLDGWETLYSMRNVDRSSLVKVMGAG